MPTYSLTELQEKLYERAQFFLTLLLKVKTNPQEFAAFAASLLNIPIANSNVLRLLEANINLRFKEYKALYDWLDTENDAVIVAVAIYLEQRLEYCHNDRSHSRHQNVLVRAKHSFDEHAFLGKMLKNWQGYLPKRFEEIRKNFYIRGLRQKTQKNEDAFVVRILHDNKKLKDKMLLTFRRMLAACENDECLRSFLFKKRPVSKPCSLFQAGQEVSAGEAMLRVLQEADKNNGMSESDTLQMIGVNNPTIKNMDFDFSLIAPEMMMRFIMQRVTADEFCWRQISRYEQTLKNAELRLKLEGKCLALHEWLQKELIKVYKCFNELVDDLNASVERCDFDVYKECNVRLEALHDTLEPCRNAFYELISHHPSDEALASFKANLKSKMLQCTEELAAIKSDLFNSRAEYLRQQEIAHAQQLQQEKEKQLQKIADWKKDVADKRSTKESRKSLVEKRAAAAEEESIALNVRAKNILASLSPSKRASLLDFLETKADMEYNAFCHLIKDLEGEVCDDKGGSHRCVTLPNFKIEVDLYSSGEDTSYHVPQEIKGSVLDHPRKGQNARYLGVINIGFVIETFKKAGITPASMHAFEKDLANANDEVKSRGISL